jgi:hypothetical protein
MEADNVGVLHLLQHLQLVVDHLFIPLDILLQDDLDGDLAVGAVSLSDNAIGSSTQCFSEAISGPAVVGLSKGVVGAGGGRRTCGHSSLAVRAACLACLSLQQRVSLQMARGGEQRERSTTHSGQTRCSGRAAGLFWGLRVRRDANLTGVQLVGCWLVGETRDEGRGVCGR